MSKKKLPFPSVRDLEVELGIEEAVAIAGIREAKPGEGGYAVRTVDGVKKFVLGKNGKNRHFRFRLAEQYKKTMLEGRWAGQWNSSSGTGNGESWIVDRNGNLISCAHRCFALFMAEHERRCLVEIGADDQLQELGLKKNKPITVKALVVVGVDPNSADTADTGRSRSLADVLFRRREFQGKEINETTLNRLSKELAVAVRLVWLRVNGERVTRGPKLHHPEALAFLEAHPLLHDAVLHVWEENGGFGKDGKKVSDLISIGYAAGLLYLAAYSHSDRKKLSENGLDMTRKPKQWAKAEEFWTLFAQDFHNEENPVRALHKVLTANRTADNKYDRDTICTLVTRAWLAWTEEEPKKWKNTRALASGLFSKEEDRSILNFERFGGFDLEKDVLIEMGVVMEDDPVRLVVDSWKVGDTCWVDQRAEGGEPWFGSIEEFADDGTVAVVHCKEDETSYSVPIEQLVTEEPEEEGQEEEEAEEELVEA